MYIGNKGESLVRCCRGKTEGIYIVKKLLNRVVVEVLQLCGRVASRRVFKKVVELKVIWAGEWVE